MMVFPLQERSDGMKKELRLNRLVESNFAIIVISLLVRKSQFSQMEEGMKVSSELRDERKSS
jgi:hypothetical protein